MWGATAARGLLDAQVYQREKHGVLVGGGKGAVSQYGEQLLGECQAAAVRGTAHCSVR